MSNDIKGVVELTKEYYDGAAHEIYKDIWGENIHIGTFDSADDTLQTAMARSNERMADGASLAAGDYVLDMGCGNGGLAAYLARTYGCRVLGSDISERELQWGRDFVAREGLSDRVAFEWADFHDLPFENDKFDVYWSQEAFLHAVDKAKVLSEAHRVLKPGGRLVFSDLLVRKGTPEADRERIYERVKSPDMWDTDDYHAGLKKAGFKIRKHEDWSRNVAPTYASVRRGLEDRRDEFVSRIGEDVVNRTSTALQFWVDSAEAGKIGWEYFVAVK